MMLDPRAPVAVFDSGLGGLSVLRELVRMMPHEDFIYFGDSANAPYGPRPTGEVRRLTCEAAERLLGRDGCKALVVACNTATAAAIADLRARWPGTPVIGIEPAVKPAAIAGAHVLVLATETTLREQKFRRLAARWREKAELYPLAAPGIVEFVERGELGGPALHSYLRGLFAPLDAVPIDAVVLGCTHFPFAREAITHALPRPVRIFDGAQGTARQTRRRLAAASLLTPSAGRGRVRLTNSLDDRLDLAARLFGAETGGEDFFGES